MQGDISAGMTEAFFQPYFHPSRPHFLQRGICFRWMSKAFLDVACYNLDRRPCGKIDILRSWWYDWLRCLGCKGETCACILHVWCQISISGQTGLSARLYLGSYRCRNEIRHSPPCNRACAFGNKLHQCAFLSGVTCTCALGNMRFSINTLHRVRKNAVLLCILPWGETQQQRWSLH